MDSDGQAPPPHLVINLQNMKGIMLLHMQDSSDPGLSSTPTLKCGCPVAEELHQFSLWAGLVLMGVRGGGLLVSQFGSSTQEL